MELQYFISRLGLKVDIENLDCGRFKIIFL